jgi:site-specific DNA-methyltransferase (adenine-specific)
VGLAINKVHQGDCVELLAKVEPGSIDLAFADPPFNIGFQYDVYHDRRDGDEYVEWNRRWMAGVYKALKPDGTFWLAIGDEYAAELKLLAQRELGFACRSWVIWYYTFGVNCTRVFSRSHTHLLYFVRNPKRFTFNADDLAVRVPSARQLVYADTRANLKGRLPDNTWILRPQDFPEGFRPTEDIWYFPRVAGTFKEREGFHGCQMPEQLLGRIIRCCSNPNEVVLDPFGGSGTTFAVAKKLGRQWIGFELSRDYVAKINMRVKNAVAGAPLDGSADPLTSAPSTIALVKNGRPDLPVPSVKKKRVRRPQSTEPFNDFAEGIVDAFKATHEGFSVDTVLADVALNNAFLETCERNGLCGDSVEWNRALLRIRKSGKLPRLTSRTRTFTAKDMDAYSFASEVALQQLSARCDATLDDVLCDPELAAQFDELAQSFSPGHSSFQYRWAALFLRKRAIYLKRQAVNHCQEWARRTIPQPKPIAEFDWRKYDRPGVYLLKSMKPQPLYIGESLFSLKNRIDQISQIPSWQKLEPAFATLIPIDDKPSVLKSILTHRVHPLLNCQPRALSREAAS